MTPKEFAKIFGRFLDNLSEGTKINSWEYVGIANVAYGTPNGSWDKDKFPGYQFRNSELSIEFIIRAIPDTGNGVAYMVVESVDMQAQLANFNLNKKLKEISDGNNRLVENYSMTVGLGAKPKTEVKRLFKKHGFNADGIIAQFKNDENIESVLTDILKWATIRRRVKIEFQNGDPNENGLWLQTIFDRVNSIPLNQILYGPPGTGKTYHTINKALAIVEGKSETELQKENRSDIKERFDGYLKSGQIVFTTFHQSLSYEDFIEGLKPNSDQGTIVYEVEDGIFKKIVNKANPQSGNLDEQLEWLKKEISEADGKEPVTIKAKGTTFDVIYRGTNVLNVQPHYSTKEKPWYPVNIDNIRKAFESGSYEGIYNPTYVREILTYLESKGLKKGDLNNQKGEENYVLIIDEINRGNVSQIFGELITLIEDSKRAGEPEALEVKLPYSKKKFSVPPNLYLIGTMNTADRSVEALDVALRRRFSFDGFNPRPELLSEAYIIWRFLWKYADYKWEDPVYKNAENALFDMIGRDTKFDTDKYKIWETWEKVGKQEESQTKVIEGYSFQGLNLKVLLEIINNRIEYLKDADHRIGHSYFMNVYNKQELAETFTKNIIPLLKEYFYNDYGKIRLVLGDGFMKKEETPKFAIPDPDIIEQERFSLITIDEAFDIIAALNQTLEEH